MKINVMRAAGFVVALGLTGLGAAHAAPKAIAVFGLYQAGASAVLKVYGDVAGKLGLTSCGRVRSSLRMAISGC